MKRELPNFSYSINQGPVFIEELDKTFDKGNCRLAIQLYFYNLYNIRLKANETLCPESYYNLGKIVEIYEDFFSCLQAGDIIFAERIRGKNNQLIDRARESFDSENEWVVALHTAIYIGESNKEGQIWHATSIANSTCFWSKEEFLYYYKPVLARRILI